MFLSRLIMSLLHNSYPLVAWQAEPCWISRRKAPLLLLWMNKGPVKRGILCCPHPWEEHLITHVTFCMSALNLPLTRAGADRGQTGGIRQDYHPCCPLLLWCPVYSPLAHSFSSGTAAEWLSTGKLNPHQPTTPMLSHTWTHTGCLEQWRWFPFNEGWQSDEFISVIVIVNGFSVFYQKCNRRCSTWMKGGRSFEKRIIQICAGSPPPTCRHLRLQDLVISNLEDPKSSPPKSSLNWIRQSYHPNWLNWLITSPAILPEIQFVIIIVKITTLKIYCSFIGRNWSVSDFIS